MPTESRYGDVTHEVKPVTSGRRLVLSFDLATSKSSTPRPTAADVVKSDAELEKTLSRWQRDRLYTRDGDEVRHLSWITDHQYPGAGLKLDSLQGHDRQIVSRIARIGAKSGFTVCLGQLDHTRSGETNGHRSRYGDVHEIVDIEESTWSLGLVVQEVPFVKLSLGFNACYPN